MGTGSTWIFTALAATVSVVIVRTARTLTHRVWAIALGGLLGGAVGNLVDRLTRWPGHFQGHVVDFIALPHYPVFNIADCAIVCSAVAMVVMSLRGIEMA
jgi:signal peptidase II